MNTFDHAKFLALTEEYEKKKIFSQSQKYIAQEMILNIHHIVSTLEAKQKEILDIRKLNTTFFNYLEKIKEQILHPYEFEPFHTQLKKPFDYTQLGLDLFSFFVDLNQSTLLGLENLEKIEKELKANNNVILFANHQIEPDPQMLYLMFKKFNKAYLNEKIIFVAGQRVIADPFAVPMSLGCNLICIYSKKHIDFDPNTKKKKQEHNKKVMLEMSRLLQKGGQLIWVAPSGGRDRPDESKEFQVAPFDEKTVEMFYLMAKKSNTPTHFYPLSLLTHSILPPPERIQKELGEKRTLQRASVHLYFGQEIQMDQFKEEDKKLLRKKRADFIFQTVVANYHTLLKQHKGHQ